MSKIAMNQSKIGGCDCSYFCHMVFTEEQIKTWIQLRFGYYSDTYFQTCLTRFKDGSAYKFMDDESRKTWMLVRTDDWVDSFWVKIIE